MCFSGSSPAPVTTSTVAAAPPPPMPAATPAQLGTARKAENQANFGNPDGPTTRRASTGPASSAVSGSNTNYSM